MPKIGVVIILAILFSTTVLALNNRSAVSLSGLDSASCTVPDPCRTFDVAISKTNDGGEVIVLSSAGYGPFTVTKSVSIISPPAYHAALAPTSGDAITVNVDNAVVVLRGLILNGSLGGHNGITFAGQTVDSSNTKLYVENCVITGFSGTGVHFARNGTLFISELIARGNAASAVVVDGSPGLPTYGSIDHALLEANGYGMVVDSATVAIRDSVAAANGFTGFYARAFASGTTANLSADNCQATHNHDGFYSGAGSGDAKLTVSNSVSSLNAGGITADTNGIVRASNNTVSENAYGLVQKGTGAFESRGNNTVLGNTLYETFGTITTFGPM